MPRKNIEDIYPLSPMQLGMMFHTLDAPGTGTYVEQIRLTMEPLDVDVFRRAWEHMFERFPALRTSVVGTGSKEPVQVVRRQVALPWVEHDGRGRSPAQQQEWMSSFLEEDRLRGFQLGEPSLVRLTLVRLGERRYELVWTLHHIVLDGWSGALVQRDLFRAYEALLRGQDPDLPPVPPFRDYIGWLRRQDMSEAETYWRETLRGFTSPTAIGGDHADQINRQVSTYAEESFQLTAELTAALRASAASQQVTVNTLCEGAWALLLSRYSLEDDVLLGTVVSGRPEELDGVQDMVGMFVNTLPLRVNVAQSTQVRQWLRDLQATQVERRQYEYSPLWQVQQWSDVPGGGPLFESLLVFENYHVAGALPDAASELKVEWKPPFDRTGYAILLLVIPGERINLRMTYDAKRFEASTIRRMLEHYRKLLAALTRADQSLGDIQLTDDAERERVLVEFNQTAQPYPAETCLHHVFEAQVDRRPEATAVVFDHEQLTYQELEHRANQLAHHLRELGVGPDVPVGMCLQRSCQMIVALLGILKAGGAYVPLDPSYPADRLDYMLENARVPVVLTHAAAANSLPGLNRRDAVTQVIDLDRDAQSIVGQPSSRPGSSVQPQNLLYVLYTSGSTGRPKGVAMPHRPLANLMHWQFGESQLAAGDVTLQFAPLSFDVSCQEIFATLGVGGCLCLIDEELRRDPEALLDLMHQRSVARVFMPFVALQQLAETAVLTDRMPSRLREVVTAGEQLQVTPALVEFFERLGDAATLVNQYGPTECHVVSSFRLTGPPRTWPSRPPIGRPIANTRLYLLDRDVQPVPVGLPGELYIGGTAVARGYLHADAKTAERFLDDPFSPDPAAKVYRTGDLGRYREDGNIEFLGRADDQVKIRGFRVELGEVESTILEHPAVRQAVAVVREDRPGDKRLVAYIVDPDGSASLDELRSWTSQRLPAYMVPAAFVRIPHVPLTPSGKIDRRALHGMNYAPLEHRASYVPPRGGVEEVLASIWADVLGVADPGVHDNFFELGGHSLMVTQLVSGIRDTLRTELALRDVFDHPTISQLAALVTRETDGAGQPALAPVPREGDLPLSFAQRRLWFLDQLGSGAAYNMPWAFRLEGALDVTVLEKSLNEITRRHEVLRTCFPPVDGKPVQHIRPAVRVPLKVIDLTQHDSSSAEAESRRLYAAEAKAPFDLAHGPLLRATVIHLPAEQHLLLLSIHHIVFDGWSIGVLNHELFTLYRAFLSSADSPLAELPVQYADFSTWQNAWLEGEVVDRQLGYWRQQLEGLPPLNLPTDRPRPPVQSYDGDGVRFELGPDLTRSLRALSQRQGVTLAMTLLAAFKTLLSRWSGQPDIAVGSPIANRSRSEVEDLIGFFVNSLVLRTDLSGDPTFVELLERVKQTSLSAYEHQDLPFERLVEELQPERDQSRNPLFQVVFALQNASRDALQLPGLKVRPFDGQVVATRFDLELHLQDLPNGLSGGFCYNVELFDRATIERLVEQFRLLLESIVADPQARISQFSILSDAERHVLLEEWNDTSVSYPVTDCLHVLFERQVERTPDHVAAVFQNEQLTYAEINRQANQLAHRLRSLGVVPDTLVGLSLDRGLDLVIGILGILKAGGGYVPLDLANPPERIAFILQDTKLRVLVTESSELEKLPGHEAQVVCLDAHRSELERESVENPTSGATPDNVAYVIYTSGSTGTPKGVLVEHGSVVRLFSATEEWFRFGTEDVWTLFHSSAFDFSVWELWGALLYGGRLVVVPFWVSRSPEDFYRLLDHEQVTVLNQTPSAFYQLILADETLGADRRLALRYIIFGGEALDLQRLKPWFERHGDERPQLVNMYGITETTVHVTYRPLNRRDLEEAPGSVIGRPIPDLQIYILDEHLAPVPIGVPGEMYVGGAGVARGYLDRPELTEQRFLRDPFSAKPDARLYRTGDVGRYLPDGDIEYLGRNDEQVKIRGYRIELGEIEAALNAHPEVRESVVALRDGQEDNRRLIGYVVPQEEGARDGQKELVGQWLSLYDETYQRGAPEEDPTFNIIGWNSSYTGEPIDADQMRDWVSETVERIRSGNPRRVLEIGCGTGLLLFAIAPDCERYLGTDFSPVALDYVARHLDHIDGLKPKVKLRAGNANDFEGLDPEAYDTVIINSVIQYFPSIEYLLEVITGAVACTSPGGRVYVGDVRSLPLLEAYHASVQLEQAPDELSVDELSQRIRQRVIQEEELVVDPTFFLALREHLPRVSGVQIEPKRGPAHNELTKFRYEVTIEVESACPDESGTTAAAFEWLDWQTEELTLPAIIERLETGPPQAWGIRGVPNARTLRDAAAAERLLNGASRTTTIGGLRRDLVDPSAGSGIDPADLYGLERTLPYRVQLSCANPSKTGALDVRFTPLATPSAPFPVTRPQAVRWSQYSNHPLLAKMTRQLAAKLRESLESSLPSYMVPSAYVMIESLPLTANGKVDRRALPEPEWFLNQRRGAYVAPRTPTERQLAEIWSELLGVDDVGVEDNFFELGGHSLLATQVVSRARQVLGVALEIRQLFDTPTIASLAESIDGLTWAVESRGPDGDAAWAANREGGVL